MFPTRGDRKRPRKSIEGTNQGDDPGKRNASNDSDGGGINSGTTRLSRIWTSLSSTTTATTTSNNNKVSTRHPNHHQPLTGIVACLSGYTTSEKDELHSMIEDLGGRYTRDFSLDANTHLITEAPVGAKYELAATSSIVEPASRAKITSTTTSNDVRQGKIRIVTRSWIDACAASKSHEKVPEADHKVPSEHKRQLLPPTLQEVVSMVDKELSSISSFQYTTNVEQHQVSLNRFNLFDSFHFYLLGFQEDQNHVHPPDTLRELKNKLSVVIRRSGGTIFWELNEDVNIIVLCDGCDDILSKAADVLSTHHPQLPPSVSPVWVIESSKRNELRPFYEYQPNPAPPSKAMVASSNDRHQDLDQVSQLTKQGTSTKEVATTAKRRSTITSSTSSQLSVFRGCLFSLLRVPPQPDQNFVLDFDEKDEATFIKSRGGQLLSAELLDAIRADTKDQQRDERRLSSSSVDGHARSSSTTTKMKRRRCYVVCWGDADGPPRLETNQLLSQVKREDLCDVVLVTPIWLRTCVGAGKCVNPNRLPVVLQPQSWPMLSLVPRDLNKMKSSTRQKHITKTDPSSTSQTDVESQGSKQSGKKKAHPTSPNDDDVTTITVCASLTGFQGTEKIALIETLNAIGCTYHDSMVPTNTHLICKDTATGLKREKAIEWSIHVVKVDWLYHILQHGIGGEKKSNRGSGSTTTTSSSSRNIGRGSTLSQSNTERGSCESQFSAL